ncbi:DUF6850 family outer membrane beta-barrel protein [Belliella pelovolcani]|uniref:DUF6850 family outer membrane beta-barrel protein n=1 Tax=Belliella pelovolcani TaxID=529505 RepID=UPI00391DF83F
MKKLFYILILINLNFSVLAQNSEWNEKLLLKSTQVYLDQFAIQPLRSNLIGQEFGFSGAYWDYTDGEFHTIQMPEKERNYGFFSYGNREVKGWLIEGYFRYQNQKQDSVGWKQTRNVNETPYYYGNIRKGNWRNEIFNSYINASKFFFRDKLGIGIGVDYSLQTHSRGNDPRPLINYYLIKPKVQVSYRFIENHQIAAGVQILSAKERGSVSNFNQSNDSFGRSEYNIYTMMGGASFNLLRRPNYELFDEGYGISAAYYYTGENLKISNEFNYSLTQKQFNRRGVEGSQRIFEEIGFYDIDIIENKIFVEYQNQSSVIQAVGKLQVSQGTDFNNLLVGNNFQQDDYSYGLDIFYTFKNLNNFNLYTTINHNTHAMRDFNASHAYEIINFNYGIGAQIPLKASKKLTLYPELSINWNQNLDQIVNIIPNQINVVSRSIMIPNIDYFSSEFRQIQATLSARYSLGKFDLNPVIFGNFNNFQPLTTLNSDYFEIRNTQRQTIGFSINFIH